MAKLLTAEEVGMILCVSTKAVYQMVYMGKLPYVKMGAYRSSPIRFKQEAIEAYIEKCCAKTYRDAKSA